MEHQPDRIDVEELVERLRGYGSEPMYGTLDGDSTEVPCAVLLQAAAALSALEKERDEARRIAGLGCDANGYGAHAPASQGAYTFCELCGETLTKAKLSGRLSQANARAQAAETELSALKALVGRMAEGLERSRDALHAAYERTGHADDLAEAHIAASLLSEAKGRG